ncbi:unnamed protein product [Spirodela intermedia]|uniref:Uncharacterized protein n=1 Tax=Spirodela intermedia TaxID=51605 RepID=A0A7I8I7P8_SPIIN|nr:unnamed protein product [Spirodela intermedia]CAA6653656.1 unnamed protein product [Spirodela intermedia]
MESGLKSRVLAVVAMAAVVGCSLVGSVAAADAPAPSPVSGAVSVAAPPLWPPCRCSPSGSSSAEAHGTPLPSSSFFFHFFIAWCLRFRLVSSGSV